MLRSTCDGEGGKSRPPRPTYETEADLRRQIEIGAKIAPILRSE
jgi:hypothetical protein